jgi:hypothetical protein
MNPKNRQADKILTEEHGEKFIPSLRRNTTMQKRTMKERYSIPSPHPDTKTMEVYYCMSQLPKREGFNRKGNEWIYNEAIDHFGKVYKRLLGTWRGRVQDAKNSNIPYEEDAWMDLVIPEYCPVLKHVKLDLSGNEIEKGGGYNAPSIDKIIPELGYVKGNIRIISFAANRHLNDIGDYPDRVPYIIEFLAKEFNVDLIEIANKIKNER